ncbi:PQQ-binding-like beta-propeller repeat protein [Steroidobacter sp.]|uniref:outer membrane protein assembly factor BamB family protein n=1 Tax=Steroidobacter sp. TaxID=1978227 RepID=UPI001A3D7E9F|nr:PQQ-binding-like beta-propeller repeat protein [Steroidobacter sp.]MBL8266003.1 PQQ-binding-like beta-propeller repeat protein [Steroidobacter sp.]
MKKISGLAMLILLSVSAATVHAAASDAAPRASDWPLIGGNAEVWHHSSSTQINASNIEKLGVAWVAEMPSRDGLVGNPIVVDGVVYQSGPLGRAYANDVRTGKLLWMFAPEIDFGDKQRLISVWSLRYSRGLSVLEDNVYVAAGDCRLFAVDRKTGKQKWEAVSCDIGQDYGITAAPRVGGGKVFIGNVCVDTGANRGFVDAFDANTGKRLWRFYTMPGDPTQPFESKTMEMAAKTWGTDYWKKTRGCVSAWDSLTYDDKLNLLYIGTGSAAPLSPPERAADAGDELFVDSIIAVNASTGEYVWHYQTVQHDGWDLAAVSPVSIAELPIKGKQRRVVMTAPKNGFFYVLDAETGKFLSASNYTDVNWASHIDSTTGRPVTIADARYWERPGQASVVSPAVGGAHTWQAMAFNPATRLAYIPVSVTPTLMKLDPEAVVGGVSVDMYYGSKGDPKWTARGELVAWDPMTQKARWRVMRELPYNSGVLSTSGNLVFQGTAVGKFDAFAADTGKQLWSFDTHASMLAAPTSVEVDGQQLVLVATGNSGSSAAATNLARYTSTPQTRAPSRLIAFKLGGTGSIPATVVQEFPKPPLPRQPVELAKKGAEYFEAEWCVGCHGHGAENVRSSIPDLRLSSPQTHQQFEAIVRGGLRRNNGMPAFPHLSAEHLQAIQAHVINEAWNAYEAQEAAKAHSKSR